MFSLCLKGAFIVLIFLTDPGLSLLMSLQNEKKIVSCCACNLPASVSYTYSHNKEPSLRIVPNSCWSWSAEPSTYSIFFSTTASIQSKLSWARSMLNFAADWKKEKILWNWCRKKIVKSTSVFITKTNLVYNSLRSKFHTFHSNLNVNYELCTMSNNSFSSAVKNFGLVLTASASSWTAWASSMTLKMSLFRVRF